MKSLSARFGLILIGLMAFGHSDALGQSWKTFYSSNYAIYRYDTENLIRPDRGVVKVQVNIVYGTRGVGDLVDKHGDRFQDIGNGVALFEVRCAERTTRIISSSYYSWNGTELLSNVPQNSEWGFITPGSVGEALLKKVCDKE